MTRNVRPTVASTVGARKRRPGCTSSRNFRSPCFRFSTYHNLGPAISGPPDHAPGVRFAVGGHISDREEEPLKRQDAAEVGGPGRVRCGRRPARSTEERTRLKELKCESRELWASKRDRPMASAYSGRRISTDPDAPLPAGR
jgi:hypothetical protein